MSPPMLCLMHYTLFQTNSAKIFMVILILSYTSLLNAEIKILVYEQNYIFKRRFFCPRQPN